MTMPPVLAHAAAAVPINRVLLPARPAPLQAHWYRPQGAKPWLVWAHGGSWHGGSLPDWDAPCQQLAALAGVQVLSVDYRLAPAVTFPGPVDDLLWALEWVSAQDGGNAQRVLIGGDSAGATLAAHAALRWAEGEGGKRSPLAGQVLAYPPLDPECLAPSYREAAVFPERQTLRRAWRNHLGHHAGQYTPLLHRDVQAAPPTLLGVGDADPVRDDVWSFSAHLAQAGVPVTLQRFPAAGHALFFRQDAAFLSWLALSVRALLGLPGVA